MEDVEFRAELLESVRNRLPPNASESDQDFAFACEVAENLTHAEELSEFIPLSGAIGTGQRGRKYRVDGYERDITDDSLKLVIVSCSLDGDSEVIGKSRLQTLFSQLSAFVLESSEGKVTIDNEASELADFIKGSQDSISHYKFYVFTDSVLSERIEDLESGDIGGKPVDYQVWDLRRLKAIAESTYGAEELDIDFTQFVPGGLPCLAASDSMIKAQETGNGAAGAGSVDYKSYLCVIPGKALAELYDKYGSRLLEGNVRSYLGVTGKINKEIQGTIRAQPNRFFIYNNGISATAVKAEVVETSQGSKLASARYLQIVNGGQTTASLHLAFRKDHQELSGIYVQMKLTVVVAANSDVLDEMIQNISKYSNKQNKVSDADFFSSHPYHRAIERMSRRIRAPAVGGAQYQTYWFYERARGQYNNSQSKMSGAERRRFQRDNPKSQLIAKTDIAKYENTWRQLPNIVSRGAQKNFIEFAQFIQKEWGTDGARLDNEEYFKELIARAILFKAVESMVTAADWYQGGYRANIVTYTIAKLSIMIDLQKPRHALDYLAIWNAQSLSPALNMQLGGIAKKVSEVITNTPVPNMNVTEWCKQDACWKSVCDADLRLSPEFSQELVAPEDESLRRRDGIQQGSTDAGIRAMVAVREKGGEYWLKLIEWSNSHSPLYGREKEMVRSATRASWVPAPRVALQLIAISERMEKEGFKP